MQRHRAKTAQSLISKCLVGRNCCWRGQEWVSSFHKRLTPSSRLTPAWPANASHALHTVQAPPVTELSWPPEWRRLGLQHPDSTASDSFKVTSLTSLPRLASLHRSAQCLGHNTGACTTAHAKLRIDQF